MNKSPTAARKIALVIMGLLTCFTLATGIRFFTSQNQTARYTSAASRARPWLHASLLTSEPVEYVDKGTIAMMDSMIKNAGPVPKYRMQMADITTQRVAQEHEACKKLHLSPEETLKRVRAVSDGGQREVERVEASRFTSPFNVQFPPVYENKK